MLLIFISCSSGTFKALVNPKSNGSEQGVNGSTTEQTAESTDEDSSEPSDVTDPADRPVLITGSWLTCGPVDGQELKYGCSVFTAPDQKFAGSIEKWELILRTQDNKVIKIENYTVVSEGVWQIVFDIPSSLATQPFSLAATATADGTSVSKTQEVPAPTPTATPTPTPIFVPSEISFKFRHVCALSDAYTIRCWGYNLTGQLGLGDVVDRSKPDSLNVNVGLKVTSIATGVSQTCVIMENNQVRCWGQGYGLGYGDYIDRYTPPEVDVNLGKDKTVVAIAATWFVTCAILNDGSLKCWGQNENGQLGYGDITSRTAPPDISVNLGSGRTAKQVAMGTMHTCALLDNNEVKCWGANTNGLPEEGGQLGYGDLNERHAPEALSINLGVNRTAKSIAVGYFHTCAILDDNSLKCWGVNMNGQLGYGDRTCLLQPNASPINLGVGRTAKMVAAGAEHTCAILDDGSVKCWGSSVGSETYTEILAPEANPLNLGSGRTAKSIATGSGAACVLLDNSSIKCWGYNDYGQLGYGDKSNRSEPPTTSINFD